MKFSRAANAWQLPCDALRAPQQRLTLTARGRPYMRASGDKLRLRRLLLISILLRAPFGPWRRADTFQL